MDKLCQLNFQCMYTLNYLQYTLALQCMYICTYMAQQVYSLRGSLDTEVLNILIYFAIILHNLHFTSEKCKVYSGLSAFTTLFFKNVKKNVNVQHVYQDHFFLGQQKVWFEKKRVVNNKRLGLGQFVCIS